MTAAKLILDVDIALYRHGCGRQVALHLLLSPLIWGKSSPLSSAISRPASDAPFCLQGPCLRCSATLRALACPSAIHAEVLESKVDILGWPFLILLGLWAFTRMSLLSSAHNCLGSSCLSCIFDPLNELLSILMPSEHETWLPLVDPPLPRLIRAPGGVMLQSGPRARPVLVGRVNAVKRLRRRVTKRVLHARGP